MIDARDTATDDTRPDPKGAAVIGRFTGVVAIMMLADFIAFTAVDPHNMFYSNPSSQAAIAWAAGSGGQVKIEGFLDGLNNTLYASVMILLLALAGGRGILTKVVYVMAGAAVALQWAHAGMIYALAELAHRGGADAGVLALYTLGYTMDDSSSIPIALALICLSVVMLRSKALPRPLAWLTILSALSSLVVTPGDIAGIEIIGPISVSISLIWALAVGITLLIKPVWGAPRDSLLAEAS